MRKRTSKIYSINDIDFIELVKESFSYSEILRKLGINTKGGNSSKLLKQRIYDLNIEINHFENKTNKMIQELIPLQDILVENSTYKNISSLKKRLIKENILEYKCEICGNEGVWNGQPMTLQLDHINGINNDHRLENIRFLCPNCHSQTDTFSGRNSSNKNPKIECILCGDEITGKGKTSLCKKCSDESLRKVARPSKEELIELIKNNNLSEIGRIYGVSDNAIRKWCKKYEINYKTYRS